MASPHQGRWGVDHNAPCLHCTNESDGVEREKCGPHASCPAPPTPFAQRTPSAPCKRGQVLSIQVRAIPARLLYSIARSASARFGCPHADVEVRRSCQSRRRCVRIQLTAFLHPRQDGVTALFAAAQAGHEGIVQSLLESKADQRQARASFPRRPHTPASSTLVLITSYVLSYRGFWKQGSRRQPLGMSAKAKASIVICPFVYFFVSAVIAGIDLRQSMSESSPELEY